MAPNSSNDEVEQTGATNTSAQDIHEGLKSLTKLVESLASQVSSLRSERDRNVGSDHDFSQRANLLTQNNPVSEEYYPPEPRPVILPGVQPEEFNGTTSGASRWLQQYEDLMTINGCSDFEKLRRVGAYMRRGARDWHTCMRSLFPDMTWREYKKNFHQRYDPNHDSQLRYRVFSAKQRDDEHPLDFAIKLISDFKELAPRGGDEAILLRLRDGLKASVVNLSETRREFEEWDIPWMIKFLGRMKVDRVARKVSDSPRREQSPKPKADPNAQKPWQCYNCNSTSHLRKDCPHPRNDNKLRENRQLHINNLELIESDTEEDPKPEEKELDIEEIQAKASTIAIDNLSGSYSRERPLVKLKINGYPVIGKLDSGADITAVPQQLAEEMNLKIEKWKEPALSAVNSTPVHVIGTSHVDIEYENRKQQMRIAILPQGYVERPLWGYDFLKAFALKIDFAGNFSSKLEEGPKAINSVEAISPQETHPTDKITIGETSPENRELFKNTLQQFADCFSKSDDDIGKTNILEHRIILSDDAPISKPPYRMAIRARELLKTELDKLLASGAIRESTSPYASPIFFVDKDHGASKRLVADYRNLNAKTVPDKTPMPHPEDIFGLLSGMKFFAKLDITAMFNQIPIAEDDIPKTAITTPFGLFEYPVMPFGLINAPATAVRLMREVLRDLNSRICFVYFDDIIVFAKSELQLLLNLRQVLFKIRKHNLKLKPKKCSICLDSLKFLGHQISAKGVQIDINRIDRVKNFPIPSSSSLVRSFLGLANYNRKFIKDFAKIAKPLSELTSSEKDFVWSDKAQVAFDTLKEKLASTPILVHFDPEANHELRTDASSYAIGAVLFQNHQDPDLTGPVLYYSKTLNTAQRNYSATERELLAAFRATLDLQHYLYGKEFTLVTDHEPLSLLKNNKDPHHRLARWVAQLQMFQFKVVYKPGKKHSDADCLSRLVDDSDPQSVSEEISLEKEAKLALDVLILDEPENFPIIDTRKEQLEDSFCKRIVEVIESDKLSPAEKAKKAPNYTVQNGQLYRRSMQGDIALVIPENRIAAVLLSCHDAPMAGHLGFKRTYNIAKTHYYWPKMRTQIKKYVASCKKCQLRKAMNERRKGSIQPMPIAEDIFDFVGIDLIVKLPRSKAGYNTILVCTDNLSKYAITVPLQNECAATITNAFFTHVIAKFSCPKAILTDQGPNISGTHAEAFYKAFGIRRFRTSPYHPQTNGQTERFNRTLKASLTNYVYNQQQLWSDYLPAVTFAYNISRHSVTGFSPFELVFGKKPRIPLDNLLHRNEFIGLSPQPSSSRNPYIMEVIKNEIRKLQDKNKNRLDAHRDHSEFEVNDIVSFERPTRMLGAAEKLQFVATGPWRIAKKLSELTYELKAEEGCNDQKSKRIVHVCTLRPFNKRTVNYQDDIIDTEFVPEEANHNQNQYVDLTTLNPSTDIEQTHSIPSPPMLSREESCEPFVVNPPTTVAADNTDTLSISSIDSLEQLENEIFDQKLAEHALT